jgi:ribosomal protein S27E
VSKRVFTCRDPLGAYEDFPDVKCPNCGAVNVENEAAPDQRCLICDQPLHDDD